MSDLSKYKQSLTKNYETDINLIKQSNPLSVESLNDKKGLSNYSQEIPRPKYDADVLELAETVRLLDNMAPKSMPEYNFNAEEINGERYKRPDGTLLLIREYDTDLIRDYYVSQTDNTKIMYIKEHDKISGRIRAKIEPISRAGSQAKTNITEFSGKGKSFKTLFRNALTIKPVRYLEGKDNKENGFEMIDCLFDLNGKVARIKRYNSKKEINITYTDTTKNISVKTKE